MALSSRQALSSDSDLLGLLNHQLIEDEGHRNPMTVPELQDRMRGWLAKEYTAVLFENEKEVVAYALFRDEPDQIYLRQFYVRRDQRQKGYGSEAMEILKKKIWPETKRLVVEVLTGNQAGISFWKAVGFQEYCLTLEMRPANT